MKSRENLVNIFLNHIYGRTRYQTRARTIGTPEEFIDLPFIESELIPYLHNRLFTFIARVKFVPFQDSLQLSKELEVARADV
jgi:hypothetical protein